MCRLSAFFGAPICAADLVTRPSRSIITQSFDARERMTGDASTPGYLNGDGFGLGWYSNQMDDPVPCVYRQARPAWNDPNLSSIAEKVYTRVLFAHVRAASPGLDVSEGTCHPFRYGRFLWMHNGGLGNFTKLRRSLLSALGPVAFDYAVTHGSSDTALCFAVFLNQIDDYMAPLPPDSLRNVLETTIAIIHKAITDQNDTSTSLLNFVVSDGETLVASRYVINLNDENAKPASLYYACGNSYQSDGTAPGNFAMMHTDRRPTLAIISSEPLTESRADWVPVPRNFCIVITKSIHILLSPVRSCHTQPSHTSDDRLTRILSNLTIPKTPTDYRISSRARKPERPSRLPDPNSANSSTAFMCPVGAAVRATVTTPCFSVLCCTIMDRFLFSGGNNGLVHVWDMDENRQHCVLETGTNAVLSLLPCQHQRTLVVGTSASSVLLYRLTDRNVFTFSLSVYCEGMGDVLSFALCGNRLFAGFSGASLRCIVDDITANFDQSITHPTNTTQPNPDSKAPLKLNASDVGYEFAPSRQAVENCGFIFALVPCLDGRFLCTGCGDGVLRIWDVAREECVQARNDHSGAILTLAMYEDPSTTMLFSGSRDCSIKIWIWDGDKGFICKRTLRKHKDEIVFLAIADKVLVSGSADGNVCVWCIDSMKLLCQYRDDTLKAGAVSHEYNCLFTATNEGGIHLRDLISIDIDNTCQDKEEVLNEIFDSIPSSVSFESRVPETNLVPKFSFKSANPKLSSAPDARDMSRSGLRRLPMRGTDQPHKNDIMSAGDGADSSLESLNASDDTQDESNDTEKRAIISDAADDSDDTELLLPGVRNEIVIPPPMAAVPNSISESSDDDNGADAAQKSTDAMKALNEDYEANKETIFGDNTLIRSSRISAHAFEKRLMQEVLRQLISFPTVSTSSEHRESCWEGARYIGRFLEGMGASVKYVNTSERGYEGDIFGEIPSKLSTKEARLLALESDSNPVVLGRFASANPDAPTITFYGHYDVMPAFNLKEWNSDPWKMEMRDGYLYGRGATDNKGPITAMIFAVKKLMEKSPNGLDVNVVLVLQGEGEASNNGFKQCILSHKHWFENTQLILTSNSTWIGENRPCLTYGFRGIVELLVTVTGGKRNLHSGVDGGAIVEPMNDLLSAVGTMADGSGSVCIPGFYDDVRPLSAEDRDRIRTVEFDLEEYRDCTGVHRLRAESSVELLESRWRKPSVSVTSIETSNGSGFFSVVPRSVSAKVSIRFVPDQDPKKIEIAVREHLQYEMRRRRSPNNLKVECLNTGDWWVGDANGEEFQIAARAVRSVWGVEPAYVCEGGSMPLFSFLGKTLNAPIVQVPLGQFTDGAHLPNERIRELNLYKGKEVLQHIIAEVAEKGGLSGHHIQST